MSAPCRSDEVPCAECGRPVDAQRTCECPDGSECPDVETHVHVAPLWHYECSACGLYHDEIPRPPPTLGELARGVAAVGQLWPIVVQAVAAEAYRLGAAARGGP